MENDLNEVLEQLTVEDSVPVAEKKAAIQEVENAIISVKFNLPTDVGALRRIFGPLCAILKIFKLQIKQLKTICINLNL